MTEQPQVSIVSIERASNGFIVTPQSTGFGGINRTVCLTLADVIAQINTLFGGA